MSATSPIFSFTEPTVGGDNGVWGGFLNTNLANLDTYLGILRQAQKTLTIGATTTLDFNAPASVFKLTVSQATTIAIANTPANITAQQLSTQFTLILINGGAFAVTWPGSFVWSGGSAPNLQVSGTDIIVGWSPDNGTTWYTSSLFTGGKSTLLKIAQLANLSRSSVSDGSLGTATLSAGKLATNGDLLRITIVGRHVTTVIGGATLRFKFGTSVNFTLLMPATSVAGETRAFTLVITVSRTGAATQQVDAVLTQPQTDSGGLGIVFPSASNFSRAAAGTEDLTAAVTLDFRGNLDSGSNTLFYDAVIVEAATQ